MDYNTENKHNIEIKVDEASDSVIQNDQLSIGSSNEKESLTLSKGDSLPIDAILYRRSYLGNRYLNPDGTATSRVYKPRKKDEGKLSVDYSVLTSPDISIQDKTQYCLFEISNTDVNSIELSAIYDKLDNNNSHSLILTIEEFDEVKPAQLAKKSNKIL